MTRNDGPLHKLFNTGDGAIAIDQQQHIIFWNAAAEQILGYAANEVLGQRCYRFFSGRTPQCTLWCCHRCDVVNLVRQEKALTSFQIVVKHKNGQSILLDVTTITLPKDNSSEHSPLLVHLFRSRGETLPTTDRLRIHLLGSTRVWRADGTHVQGRLWRQTKVRALLAYLAVHNGYPIHQETLIEHLWPDMNVKSGRHNLYTAVHNLRRSLEPGLPRTTESRYILSENSSYMLNGGLVHWLDIEAFKTALKHARQESDVEQALALYEEAIDLYLGDFLADLGNMVSWHYREQERLRELYLDALEELGHLYDRLRQDKQATDTYLKVLSLDPCRERACQSLMNLYFKQGDRPAALARYQTLLNALERELAVMPSTKTQALYQTILQTP